MALPELDTLNARFEAAAAEFPERTAVTLATENLSYATLNQKANRLARYLNRQGLETGQRVGLYLNRTPEVVISILAILKAGGAYVPLDPGNPEERLRGQVPQPVATKVQPQPDGEPVKVPRLHRAG